MIYLNDIKNPLQTTGITDFEEMDVLYNTYIGIDEDNPLAEEFIYVPWGKITLLSVER